MNTDDAFRRSSEEQQRKAAPEGKRQGSPDAALSEKQRRELWMYIAVSITAVELLLLIGAVLYGFMSAGTVDPPSFVFPWLSWGALALVCPALILLLAHLADVGLFRTPKGASSDQDWQKHLPERMRRLYRLVKGAPTIVILLGVVLLGAALLTLDGALSALTSMASALQPYIPHIVIGLAVILCVIVLAAVWLSYRTRRLMAEYAFRREVLEKTGVIIVDKGSSALPPGGDGPMPYAIGAGNGSDGMRALPRAEEDDAVINAEAREIDPPADGEALSGEAAPPNN